MASESSDPLSVEEAPDAGGASGEGGGEGRHRGSQVNGLQGASSEEKMAPEQVQNRRDKPDTTPC